MARYDLDFQNNDVGDNPEGWAGYGATTDIGGLLVVEALDCPLEGIDRGLSLLTAPHTNEAIGWTGAGLLDGDLDILTLMRVEAGTTRLHLGGGYVAAGEGADDMPPRKATSYLVNILDPADIRVGYCTGDVGASNINTQEDLAITAAEGDWIWGRTRIVKSTRRLSARAWKFGTNEPAGWHAEMTVAAAVVAAAGYPGFSADGLGGTLAFMAISTDIEDPARRIPPLTLRTLTTQSLIQDL